MQQEFMNRALALAAKGEGRVNPNPLVGAVLVRAGQVIGEGWHQRYGEAHAEVNALADAERRGESVVGAELYVTLEPCSHYGKTPPCTEQLIEAGVGRVYVGMVDPNPLVAGRGLDRLRAAGIEVEVDVLADECRRQNEVFLKYITERRPFVVLKTAMSLDGKIATVSGESRWISCEESRHEVHHLRNRYSGIMVGIETVLKDDPQLTARLPESRNPVRIVTDSRLRLPFTAKVLDNLDRGERCLVAALPGADAGKLTALRQRGAEVLICRSRDGRIELADLCTQLGELGIDSILLEGGSELNFSALQAGLVDKVISFIAPKLIGGRMAPTPIGGVGIAELAAAYRLRDVECRLCGEDIMVSGYPQREEAL